MPPSVAVALLALALLPLFTPAWTHFALRASNAGAFLATPAQAEQASDRTIGELLFGPATWDYEGPGGRPFYTDDEVSHLRDVRLVLYGFLLLAGLGAGVLASAWMRYRHDPQLWRSVARGAAALVVGVIVVGGFAALAFGAAFELFHTVLFPGGNWAFPAGSNLIRLYPVEFWQLSAAALGTLALLGGGLVWLYAARRAARLERE